MPDGCAAFGDALVSRIVFRPSRTPIACAKRRHWVAAGSRRVEAWVESSAAGREPALFVLRFLGARGRAENGMTDPLNRLPEIAGETWIANPPGFGGSDGPVSLERDADDALAVFDAVAAHAAGRPVWVQGQSVGTLAALHVAAQRTFDWLVLRNVTPVRELLHARLPAGARWLAPLAARAFPPRLDAPANAARARMPALFVTSVRDGMSPPVAQRAIFDRYAGAKARLDVDCGHADHVLPPADEARYAALVVAQSRHPR